MVTWDNSNTHLAQKNPSDEFYTEYKIIQDELCHYKEYFKNKTVLCNCNDGYTSNFYKYFRDNFEKLGLKKLITTSYARHSEENAYKLIIDKDNKEPQIYLLEGNGSFDSPECLELLKEADIVVSNPPFTLKREYLTMLLEYGKDFLFLCSPLFVVKHYVFPLIITGKVKLGYRCESTRYTVPDTYTRQASWKGKDGKRYQTVNSCWLTTLPIKPEEKPKVELTCHYTPDSYPYYDNQQVIEVDSYKRIPADYDGVMGVPISFLKYHNGLQFDIVGYANHGTHSCDWFIPHIKGKAKFMRILIKRRTLI